MGRKFNLLHEDKLEVDILAATYFYCSSITPNDAFGRGKYKGLADLGEITQYGVNRVEAILGKHNLIDYREKFTIIDMIIKMKNISDRTDSVLTKPNISATIANSWFGEAGVLYCNLAMEYPPMFLTMIYYAIIDRGYIRTNFAELIKPFITKNNAQDGDLFVKQMGNIIKALKIKDHA